MKATDMRGRVVAVAIAALAAQQAGADADLSTKFLNQGSVANTRHNMTQRQAAGGGPNGVVMDPYRNDYGEVCVYCHTPHGANANVQLPLWNRTIKATSYVTYDALATVTLTQPVQQPGPNSISCLSCHDGQTAIDSVINMPGSGGYNPAQASAQDNGFLNAWNNASGLDATVHVGLNPTASAGLSGLPLVGCRRRGRRRDGLHRVRHRDGSAQRSSRRGALSGDGAGGGLQDADRHARRHALLRCQWQWTAGHERGPHVCHWGRVPRGMRLLSRPSRRAIGRPGQHLQQEFSESGERRQCPVHDLSREVRCGGY